MNSLTTTNWWEFNPLAVSTAIGTLAKLLERPAGGGIGELVKGMKDLAELLTVNPADVIRELIKSGIFATINQLIDRETATLVAGELGYEVVR